MVYRVFVEKKPGFDVEAQQLLLELRDILGVSALENIRVINRYDAEGLSAELFERCVPTVFSEPQSDNVASTLEELLAGEDAANEGTTDATAQVFAVEYLPGQFDQRANSAAECIQLISQGEQPAIRSATVYVFAGELSQTDITTLKHYLINPVEAREAALAKPETLTQDFPEPADVETLEGFLDLDDTALETFIAERGLAMDLADLKFLQQYFASEGRPPTITEVKMVDTYWSDHCRHTTFGTQLTDIEIADANVEAAFNRYLELRHELNRDEKPLCLMDMGTIGARYLKHKGKLTGLDESEEINACTVRVKVDVDGKEQDWLYLFKNETHNHPTEIEPFGGAATCVGGAIRDPLSGRSYVYQAMRITGAADPRVPVSETLPGKLPQRKLCITAAQGFSSYGNQIGLTTGQVHELYHPGYAAKRMEIGAVVGATPANHVRRETPAPGDVIVLLGGRTGRDGIGGATGSSKAHSASSLEHCGAEVQKGNAPQERKIQRLFRMREACRMIKRCNDFGAGGVSVAIGELADGLEINLDAVPLKYAGLDGTEIAISESQERMACALAASDADAFIALAHEENLEATVVATVTAEPRVRMMWRGQTIVDVSREFLASNGAPKFQKVEVSDPEKVGTPEGDLGGGVRAFAEGAGAEGAGAEGAGAADAEGAGAADAEGADASTYASRFAALVSDINIASNKGLVERFDSTIGAATVLMPFGGKTQLTPTQAMVAKLPVLGGKTTTVSGLSWGFNPYLTEADPYTGSYIAVLESICKLVACGFERRRAYLTFQEYFEKLGTDPKRWGKPVAAVLGALMAQIDLGVGAIGGKDSMSGSFENLDVPPTLVSFATAIGSLERIVSPEFKAPNHDVLLVSPMGATGNAQGVAAPENLIAAMDFVESLIAKGEVLSASTIGAAGVAEALFKASVGNQIGFAVAGESENFRYSDLFKPGHGAFVLELAPDAAGVAEIAPDAAEAAIAAAPSNIRVCAIGKTARDYTLTFPDERVDLAQIQEVWESSMEGVFPYRTKKGEVELELELVAYEGGAPVSYSGKHFAKPHVVIPVFPGTNCEYDTRAAFEAAGARVSVYVINNLQPESVRQSVSDVARLINDAQIVMIPGGFSGGDEPDGSAKLITAFFRAPEVTEAVRELLQIRDGLMLGICNGFQALVKLGLVPYGDIVPMTDESATLTYNTIGRHQSKLVNTRVASNLSPWFANSQLGDIHTVAISHGEGRFVAPSELLVQMIARGQVATQYVDASGAPSMDLAVNPNGSLLAIEGITSPDGRILGKMGHSERRGRGLYKNVPGNLNQPIFEAGIAYFA